MAHAWSWEDYERQHGKRKANAPPPTGQVTSKPNTDRRCEHPDACQARGGDLCRGCNMRSLAKALHADPEFKARLRASSSERMKALNADPEFKARLRASSSERMKALHADPEFKAKCGHLTEDQIALILDEIKNTKRNYIEIGLDWLISPNHVGHIGRAHGIQRRPRRLAA